MDKGTLWHRALDFQEGLAGGCRTGVGGPAGYRCGKAEAYQVKRIRTVPETLGIPRTFIMPSLLVPSGQDVPRTGVDHIVRPSSGGKRVRQIVIDVPAVGARGQC